MGYGIAAFGVGPLQDAAGISLSTLYGATAVVAVAMGVLSFVVVRRRPPELAASPRAPGRDRGTVIDIQDIVIA